MGKQTAELLSVAKVWLTHGPGWDKGQLFNTKTGSLCALGAVYAASHEGDWEGPQGYLLQDKDPAKFAAQRALENTVPECDMGEYNDARRTTLVGVLRKFDLAIKSTLSDSTSP